MINKYRMPIIVLTVTVLTGVLWGSILKKQDIAAAQNMASVHGEVSPSPSPTLVATSVPATAPEPSRGPEWRYIENGKQALFLGDWTVFKWTDPINGSKELQICGYDTLNVNNRLCVGGQYKNTSLHVDGSLINMDMYGATSIEARFVFPDGSYKVNTYTGLASTQAGGAIVAGGQTEELWDNVLKAAYTVIRVDTYDGPVVMRFAAFPDIKRKEGL